MKNANKFSKIGQIDKSRLKIDIYQSEANKIDLSEKIKNLLE